MTMVLKRNGLLSARSQVRCLSGLLWVTVDGDREDYLLKPGEAMSSRKRMVVQALRESVLEA